MIIFKLREVQARYNITNISLASALGVNKSLVSEYRTGAKQPKLERINQIMQAIAQLAGEDILKVQPLALADLIEWRMDEPEKSQQIKTK